MSVFTSLLPQFGSLSAGQDWVSLLKSVLVFAVVIFALGTVLRMIFGKESNLTRAVSASLTIFLAYLTAILVYLFLPEFRAALPQLPFITVDEHRLVLWELSGLSGELLYSSLIRLAALALITNLLEALVPQGEKFLSWYGWRVLTIIGVLAGYSLLCGLVVRFLPELFGSWAKLVIIGLWGLILLSGVLKLLLGVILTVMNPIVGALYAFFFSNVIGSQFSKSILTTAIVAAVVEAMNQLGFTQFAFSDFSLAGYCPACVILALTLYLFGKFL